MQDGSVFILAPNTQNADGQFMGSNERLQLVVLQTDFAQSVTAALAEQLSESADNWPSGSRSVTRRSRRITFRGRYFCLWPRTAVKNDKHALNRACLDKLG